MNLFLVLGNQLFPLSYFEDYKKEYVKMSKETLPSKTCPACSKKFTWRKKWRLNWENVRYCSKKCSDKRIIKK